MTTSTGADSVQVQVQAQREISAQDVEYARQKVTAALDFASRPVLHARARLSVRPDPAVARPATAQVNLDVEGRLVRTQAAGVSVREAVDEAHDRLRDRLQRATGNWEEIRGRRPQDEPHEWRHASAPTERPPYFPRPADEREVVRHKAFSLGRMSIDEAAFDMDLLDYDFHLFAEEGSDVDSVLYRTDGPVPYRLAQADPQPDRISFSATPVTISAAPAPVLDQAQAIARLEVTGWPFVFFRDAADGRGCLLYHRYDGHYGLITPAEDGAAAGS